MTPQVSVLVRVAGPAPWLTALASSLDAQTLDYDSFETVLVLADPNGPAAERAADLARRRPNVRVVHGEQSVTEQAHGRWIVDLGNDLDTQRPVLFPGALARLVAFGDKHGCTAVLGRPQLRGSRAFDQLFAADAAELDAQVLGSLTGPNPLVALTAQAAEQVGTLPRPADVSGPVGVLGGYPTTLISGSVDAGRPDTVTKASGHWVDATLELRATLSGDAADDAAPVLHLRNARTFDELALPTRIENEGDSSVVVAQLDVRAATDEGPLADGPWELHLVRPGTTSTWIEPAPVPPLSGAGALPSAVFDGRLVASSQRQDRQVVDVGATSASVIGKVAAATGSVVESARGSLLTFRLDDLTVVGAATLRGQLFLGNLVLPADLIVGGDGARLESWVSGLPDTVPIHTRFGNGPRTATGLSLQIEGDGAISVVPEPPAPPKAAAKKTPAAKAPRRKSLTAKVSDRVPEPLRPAVQAVARNPRARRAYRAVRARRNG